MFGPIDDMDDPYQIKQIYILFDHQTSFGSIDIAGDICNAEDVISNPSQSSPIPLSLPVCFDPLRPLGVSGIIWLSWKC
jgi:hypothetical protein